MSTVGTRPGAVAAERWLPRQQQSAGVARHMLRRFLTDGQSEQFSDVAELVLSELVTNAVAHARVPGRMIAVRLELLDAELRIEVHDASNERPVLRSWPEDDAESGRGLWLVQTLANAWGCCPRHGGVGKFVWAVCGSGGGA